MQNYSEYPLSAIIYEVLLSNAAFLSSPHYCCQVAEISAQKQKKKKLLVNFCRKFCLHCLFCCGVLAENIENYKKCTKYG